MVLLSIDIDDALVQEWLAYAGYHIRDARDPLGEIRDEVIRPAIEEQIRTQGMRSGDPYRELTEPYRLRKEAQYGVQPILVASGDMRDDLDEVTAYRITRDSMTYEPSNDYAHWHQTGGYVENRPPQRIILKLIPNDYQVIENIFQDWLDDLRVANRRRPSDTPGGQSMPNIFIL